MHRNNTILHQKKKLLYTTAIVTLMSACNTATTAAAPSSTTTAVAPQTIGYDAYNAIATDHLHANLSNTTSINLSINNQTYPLTATETAELLALLKGAKSAETRGAPADCFYLNLQDSAGQWLMSLPVQNTPNGIVLLYLQLQNNAATTPLQTWWQAITTRLGL